MTLTSEQGAADTPISNIGQKKPKPVDQPAVTPLINYIIMKVLDLIWKHRLASWALDKRPQIAKSLV